LPSLLLFYKVVFIYRQNFSITFEIYVGNDDDIVESTMQICKTNSLLHNTTLNTLEMHQNLKTQPY